MSKIIPIAAVLVSLAFADTLYLKDGREIKDATVTKISDAEVEYKIGKRETVYTAKKSSIASILYDDGTEDVFEPKPKEEPVTPVAAAKGYEGEKAEELPPTKKTEKKQAEAEQKEIRFGVRGNGGRAQVSPNKWEGDFSVDGGGCFGIGAFALIPFMSIYFVPEIALERREPIVGTGTTLTETAIDVPMHFRFRYREENLIYLGIGPFLGLVLSSEFDEAFIQKYHNYRSKMDFGFAIELGFRISDNFSIDIRGMGSFTSIGLTELMEKGDGVKLKGPSTLIQSQIGLSYTF
jgi:hypothetical protein